MMSLSVTLGVGLLFTVVAAEKAPQQPVAKKPTAQQPPVRSSQAQKPAAQAPAAQAPAAAKSTAQAPAPKSATQPQAAKPAATLHPVEEGILARTNAQRARYGLRPLRLDFGLQNSARRHAQWMSRNRTMQHTSAPVAENIAMGQNSSQEAVNSWMNSSGHRANILNSGYTRIGVAAYRTPQGTTFWCQQFMR